MKRKMSYEALYDKKSDLSNLRIISCQVWTLISKKKHSKFDLRFSDCRLLDYAASTQYILYEMNSDQIIYSHDIIFDDLSEAEADHLSSDWIFDFDLSDELMQLICFYTQKSLFSETNIESFSASHVIDHVEASTAESSAKLLIKLPVKSCEKQQDRSKTKSKIKSTSTSVSKSMIEFSMSSADKELNEMLNFLHLNILDEMFFSNYDQKWMSFRALQNIKAGSWMTVLSTSCNANCQLWVLTTSKFEQEPKSYQETMKSVNHTHWKVTMNDQYQSLIENKIWILIKRSDVSSCCQVLNEKWVYKLKTSSEYLYKTCWVIKDFN